MRKSLNILVVIVCFASGSLVVYAEPSYPPTWPEAGESRPSWWFEIYDKPVLVLEGTISNNEKDRPDIRLDITDETLQKLLGKKNAEISKQVGTQYLIGTLNIKKVLFVPSSLAKKDVTAKNILNGKITEIPVLLRAYKYSIFHMVELGDDYTTYVYRSSYYRIRKENRILIFRRGNIYPLTKFMFVGSVPRNDLVSLNKILTYRKEREKRLNSSIK